MDRVFDYEWEIHQEQLNKLIDKIYPGYKAIYIECRNPNVKKMCWYISGKDFELYLGRTFQEAMRICENILEERQLGIKTSISHF